MDNEHRLQEQIISHIDSLIRDLEETKKYVRDHPATIMTNMLNVSSNAVRISFIAGRLRGKNE